MILSRPHRLQPRFGFAVCLALFALAASSILAPALAGPLQLRTITVKGEERNYYISIPPDFVTDKRYALMFVLHGGQGDGTVAAQVSRMVQSADKRGFIAVFPNAGDRQWNDGRDETAGTQNDVAFIKAIIEALKSEGSVDSDRVFVSGISNGGIMAQRLACDTGLFAGVAVIAANMPLDYVSKCTPPKNGVPFIFFLGTADPLMPYEGGRIPGAQGSVMSGPETVEFWAKANGCGKGKVKLLADKVDDGTVVYAHTYSGCDTGADVKFFEVRGGGHTWPGTDVSTPKRGLCTEDINGTKKLVGMFKDYGL